MYCKSNMNKRIKNDTIGALYVGDLHSNVTEAQLYEKFSTAGRIASIHVCRDKATHRSLGYAYVNFEHVEDAERALDTMNFDLINGSPIRIMWSQRDPSLRKSGVENIFIKNLSKSVDNRTIYDTFSVFGNILSCKVAQDENGESKGYGFVHFETEEAATKAIENVNGILLKGKPVFVCKFVAKEREKELIEKDKLFTNVYVNNLGKDITKSALKEMFEKYGHITSHTVVVDQDQISRGFGFVAFEDPKSAKKAVDGLNGNITAEGKILYVGRAKTKAEIQQDLNNKFELAKIERANRYQGVNLYVKNLDVSIDDERLRKEFGQYGTITSAKVMHKDGKSQGFGFVCFSSPEEATKAVIDMNSRIVETKPLFVALAQRKDERTAQLHSQYVQRLENMRTPQIRPILQPGTTSGYFVPTLPQPLRLCGPAQVTYGNPQTAQPNVRPNAQAAPAVFQNFFGEPFRCAPRAGSSAFVHQGLEFAARPQAQQAIYIQGQESFTMLTAAEQKKILGDRLYPLISVMHSDLAENITGMLLEIDNADLLHLLEDSSLLKAKVDEAVAVLQAYQGQRASHLCYN